MKSSNYKRSSLLYLRKSEGNFENSLILYKICSTKLLRYFVYDSIKLGLLWLLLLRFMSDVAHRPLVFPRQFLFLSVLSMKKASPRHHYMYLYFKILLFTCVFFFFSLKLSSSNGKKVVRSFSANLMTLTIVGNKMIDLIFFLLLIKY